MNFERGQDPKEALNIGKKASIEKWFEEWAPMIGYTINQDLSIDVAGWIDLSNTKVTSLPDNLNVIWGLDLSDTSIASLPDNLRVGVDLYLKGSKITSLPDSLSVGGEIFKDF